MVLRARRGTVVVSVKLVGCFLAHRTSELTTASRQIVEQVRGGAAARARRRDERQRQRRFGWWGALLVVIPHVVL